MNRIKKHYFVSLYLVIYFLIIANQIIFRPTPFYDWDEAIYAQVGREMVAEKSLVPLWQGQYWLDKPPLAPLFYGFIGLAPINPEISTRLATLTLSIIALLFIYFIYYRVSNNRLVSLGSVILTSLTPIFYQRAQVLNVDIFLLIGWFGYLLFNKRFWVSFIFLVIGVMSKSLLGFYPLIGIAGYYFIDCFILSRDDDVHSIPGWKKYLQKIKPLLSQVCLISIWYLVMIIIFKYQFIQAHFFDSHLKRVTASIESHFGTRIYYFEALYQQFGPILILSLVSLFFFLKEFITLKNTKKILLGLFFVPWFLFLNVTKTKIAWYIYPVIPQFAFLTFYGQGKLEGKQFRINKIRIFSNKVKLIFSVGMIFIIIYFIHLQVINNKIFANQYSNYDDSYRIAIVAQKHCQTINVLVDQNTRKANQELADMNLLITTSRWWGNHPSIVYYSKAKVNFIYDSDDFVKLIKKVNKNACYLIDKIDQLLISDQENVDIIRLNNSYILLR